MIFDLDKWQEIYHALKKNKLRTALTAFGVFWGLFMLVVMLGAGYSLKNGVTGQWKHMNFNSTFMWSQNTTMPYKGFKPNRRYNFTNDDMVGIKENIPEVSLLSPRLEAPSWRSDNKVTRGKVSKPFKIYGDYPDINVFDPRIVVDGRFLNNTDIMYNRKVAVIGLKVYNSLFKNNEKAIGQDVKINGIYFTVIGVIKSYKSGWNGNRENESVHLPLTTLQKTFNYGNTVGWFGVTAAKGVNIEDVEKKVKRYLRKRHKIHPEDERAIGSNNIKKNFDEMNSLFDGINLLIWIVGIGTLLSGVIGISNIMLIVVKERTKEIGIKRAIGAKPFNIVSLIISESVILTFLSGYIGLALGVGLLELVGSFMGNGGGDMMFAKPEVDFDTAFNALIIVVISGVLAGLIPAMKAIKVKPIDALRYE
jgi:putative ABC transport system permease protein